jgi:photosystem II stability/assembly factor-like uncharacterized protein
MLSLLALLTASCSKKVQPVTPQAPSALPQGWVDVHPPLKPTGIAAISGTFWLCGSDETIASSSDGGATWKVRHKKPGGSTLHSITFVDEKVGHAAGQDGLLLSTADGGATWANSKLGSETVQALSFADALNGIVAASNHRGNVGMGMLDEVQGAPILNSHVMVTHDGGQHWEDIDAFRTNADLRPYTELLSVAALDAVHFLIGVRQPQVAVGYAVTTDAGKTWKLVQVDNVYATRVFVHEGEYWAFGIEYLDRQKGGGYGAPVSLHSKDGEVWIHGVRGPREFWTCNPQGCYVSDGLLVDLYGAHEKFWVLPRDGSMTKTWAIAGNRACTVSGTAKCAAATLTDQFPSEP